MCILGIIVILVGIWVRGALRGRAAQSALQSGRWDDALSLDSSNVQAYLARAIARTSGDQKSIEGALDDIEQATKRNADPRALRDASARVHAAYAACLANAGELSSAEQQLEKCLEQTPASDVVAATRTAIAEGWIRQAATALNEMNAAKAHERCLAAQRYGAASPEFVRVLKESCTLLAKDALTRSNTEAAIGFMTEIGEASSSAFAETMATEPMTALRDDVAASLRNRFSTLASAQNYSRAITCLLSLSNVDPATFLNLLDDLSAFPADAILGVPPIFNSLGMEFKLLPAGEFMMGDENEDGGGKTRQTIPRVFVMGVTEVTNEQYSRVMGGPPGDAETRRTPQCPVDGAKWDDAVAFCKKLSAMNARQAPFASYRLPRQLEWEYACRAGSTTHFCCGNFSDDMDSGWGNSDGGGLLGQHCWFKSNSPQGRGGGGFYKANPVRTKQPNQWGLYDMHGNVWEWCLDSDKPGYHVARGGCHTSSAESCRSGCKDYAEKFDGQGVDTTGVHRGFRVVLQLGRVD
jgi:formylglycine-generating enzyme required for sulfatase activity